METVVAKPQMDMKVDAYIAEIEVLAKDTTADYTRILAQVLKIQAYLHRVCAKIVNDHRMDQNKMLDASVEEVQGLHRSRVFIIIKCISAGLVLAGAVCSFAQFGAATDALRKSIGLIGDGLGKSGQAGEIFAGIFDGFKQSNLTIGQSGMDRARRSSEESHASNQRHTAQIDEMLRKIDQHNQAMVQALNQITSRG